jgi:hydroxypyruvate reductase
VPGDDPGTVASGPTVADPSTLEDARAVVRHYGLELPEAVRHALDDPANESPKPGDPRLARVETRMIATPRLMLEAAAADARRHGLEPLILGDALEGEARVVGKVMAGIATFARDHESPAKPPCVLLSGGETTVTVKGEGGRGGRNTEFLLGMALALNGAPGIAAIACDTDGIDGSEDNAGALLLPDSLRRMRAARLDPAAALAGNDAYSAFEAVGDLVVSGPTLTNVNDFRAVLVDPRLDNG